MKMRFLLGVGCLLISAVPSFAATVPAGLQLFLLIGQSNMAGRGPVEPADRITNPQIFMFTQDLQWTLATDPLHFDNPGVVGVGPGSEFARTLVRANHNLNVGLIPCAVGGSSLAQWKPGGTCYTNTLTRAREAMKQGTLAGILWHQGESDEAPAKVATYAARFGAMIGQLRTDLQAETVPVVVGEIGRFTPESTAFNAVLPEVARIVPRCAFVTSEGLTDKGDHLHFDSPSQRLLGQRYAAAYLKLAGTPVGSATP